MSHPDTNSNHAVHGSVASRDMSPRTPNGPNTQHNGSTSQLGSYVNGNQQTQAGTSHEALHRYFSSPENAAPRNEDQPVQGSIDYHRSRAQAAIDAVDAVMEADAS